MNNSFFNKLTVHPFLLALFPFLFLISHNIEQLMADDITGILLAIAVTVCAAALIWLALSFILKDRKKAAIIVSLGLILFFSYGHFISLIDGIWKDIHIGNFTIGYHKTFLMLWGIIFLTGAYFLWRTRKNLNIATGFLNVISVALVVITLISIGAYELRGSPSVRENTTPENGQSGIVNIRNLDEPPDIYYLILDMYASSKTLQEIYNYDNSEFTGYLAGKNFYIASESHSNYQSTHCSLASSLNMEYLEFPETMSEESIIEATVEMACNNRVMALLKSRGYRAIHIGSGWSFTKNNKYADINIAKKNIYTEYLNVLIQTTMAAPFLKISIQEDRAQTILYAFSEIAKIPEIEGPTFTFAHIVCPHPPYVFGADGEPVPEASISMTGETDSYTLYLNQLTFVNKKVVALINDILDKSKTPPVIIIQSDHGTMSTFPSSDEIPWTSSLTPNMAKERFGILNAYYFPGNGDELLYSSISPVNSFRLIFNYYFGADYELLDDRCYYYSSERPYEFIDVTDKIK